MDPDTTNYVILCIHVKKILIPSHAIQRQTSVSARYGSKKTIEAESQFQIQTFLSQVSFKCKATFICFKLTVLFTKNEAQEMPRTVKNVSWMKP